MAWIYLAESVESQSHLSPGCAPSLIVSESPTLKVCCCRKCFVENSIEHLSGMMSLHSADECCQVSTSSSADSHAKTSALQELGKAWKASEADCFSRSCAWPKKRDPASYSLKTSQQSELEVPHELEKNWPAAGMIADGQLFPLKKLERTTNAKDGSCLLPTPTASDYGTGANGVRKGKQKQIVSLGTMARKNLWPTPLASDPVKVGHGNLSHAVKMWPTPLASDHKAGWGPGDTNRLTPRLQTVVGGQLNPKWVEWLMGFPLEWTALDAWATQWFHSKRVKRSKNSQASINSHNQHSSEEAS